MNSIKLFKDGKLMYIVIEDPSETLESLLIKMIGSMTSITDTAEGDNDIIENDIPDTSRMKEVDVIKTPPVEKKQNKVPENPMNTEPEENDQEPAKKIPQPKEHKPIALMTEQELRDYLIKRAHERNFLFYVKQKYKITGYMKRFIEKADQNVLFDIANAMENQ